MNKCLNCGKEVKNKYCSSKCRNQHKPTVYVPTIESINKQKESVLKKWKTFNVNCYKCDISFEIKEFNVDKPKKEKYYCSINCANSHTMTDDVKQKISDKNKGQIPWNKGKYKLITNDIGDKVINNKDKYILLDKRITKVCPICNNEFIVRFCENDKIYCSKKCYTNDINFSFRKKTPGGMRIGSGRGKSGWYKGYWSDSSWELAWIIYNIDHNIIFERNKKWFSYTFNNIEYKFYPDFICNNEYFEIKGYIDEKNKSKLLQFNEKLTIIDKKSIQPYIKYVIEKYGKNYIELYENNPHKIKNNKCLICGEECVNMYCSRICSGKGVRLLKN